MKQSSLEKIAILTLLCMSICVFGFTDMVNAAKAPEPARPAPPEGWERHATKEYAIDTPVGWKVTQGGSCDSFAIFAQDPQEPLRQVFFFSRLGPVYAKQAQRLVDAQYKSMTGNEIAWFDMPAVDPLTPINFLKNMPQMMQTQIIRQLLPERPGLRYIEVISNSPQKPAFKIDDSKTEIIRALFIQDNKLGEGEFLLTVSPFAEYTESPGSGTSMGYTILGFTGPQGTMGDALPQLAKISASLFFGKDYVKQCREKRAEAWVDVIKAGATLSGSTTAVQTAWQKRPANEDELSVKAADRLKNQGP